MKTIPFLELQSQFRTIEPETRAAIERVLHSGWFILGDELAQFEREFAAYAGVNHVCGVGNGTDAIQLALIALGAGHGGEVITAANTCVPTVAGILGSGATPILVDASPDTLTLDPAQLDRAITPRTRAIVPVHLYGHPCDMNAICAVAASHKLHVVEDCAQAHGAEYRGKPCGTFGDAAAFSFYPSKNLGAFGDAGAVATNSADTAERVQRLRNYGKTGAYTHESAGINSRLDELQAAILRAKLPHLNDWNAARRERAQWYNDALRGAPCTLPPHAEWANSCWHLYAIRTPHRDALQAHLTAHGIATQIHYAAPIHLLHAYRHLGNPGKFPVAEAACAETLSLPLYPELTHGDIDCVADAVHAFRA
jgi:dTDP-4-amino-4,6-dideoxygalactose transaminase